MRFLGYMKPDMEASYQSKISPALYTTDFSWLARTLPFVISIAGVIGDVQPEGASAKGVPMKNFTLRDSSGQGVSCIALGDMWITNALSKIQRCFFIFCFSASRFE